MINCKCAARKRYDLIAGADIVPWISRHYICAPRVLKIKLLCRILETVIETCTASTTLKLLFICFLELKRITFKSRCREYDCFSLLNRQFEITRNPKVFLIRKSAVFIFIILNPLIPMAVVYPRHRLIELHVQIRISFVKACGNSVFHGFVDCFYGTVFNAEIISVS